MENQYELMLSRPPQKSAISIETVRAQKTPGAAFTLACNISGLEDKEIYLNIITKSGKTLDPGYFSNIKKSDATLQADLVPRFCELVGNTVYPEWCAYQMGCTLMMIQTEAERRAEEFERLLKEERIKNRVLVDALHGRVAA